MAGKKPTAKAEAVTKPAEGAASAGKETVETVMKAGTQAATAGYDQAVALTKEQVERTSKAMFKGYGDFASLGQDNVDAMVRSGTIMAKGLEVLGNEMMAFARTSMEDNVAATKALFGVKSVRELVDMQTEYTRKNMNQFLAESAKLTELSVKVANEAMEPIQARVNVAVEKIMKPQAM